MNFKKRIENNVLAWFFSAIITGFVGGIGTYEAILRIAKLQVVTLNRVAEDEMLRKKDRFLSLYLRYALTHLQPFAEKATDEDRRAAKLSLDDYILHFVDAADKSESIVAIGKGDGTQTTVRFPDGSLWDVPPDFQSAVGN